MIQENPEQVISPVGNDSSRDGCMAVGDERDEVYFEHQSNLVGPCLKIGDQDEQVMESDDENTMSEDLLARRFLQAVQDRLLVP